MPSAQVMISGSWDRAPHWAPAQCGVCFSLSLSPCSCSLFLCQMNKSNLKTKIHKIWNFLLLLLDGAGRASASLRNRRPVGTRWVEAAGEHCCPWLCLRSAREGESVRCQGCPNLWGVKVDHGSLVCEHSHFFKPEILFAPNFLKED